MKKLILILLLASMASTVSAQGKHADPRIHKGLDISKIPVLKTYKDLKAQPGSLKKGAVKIGNAEFIQMEAPATQTISKIDAGHSLPNDFALWKAERASNGTVNWMWRASVKPQGQIPQMKKNVDGLQVLQDLKTTLRITDPKTEFTLYSTSKDELGSLHLRYSQVYKNIPVWNRDLYVHFNASGEPYIINGTYEPTPVNISITPAIVAPYAIIITIADLKSQNKWAPVGAEVAKELGYPEPNAKLVLYPEQNGKLRLAYEVSIVPNLLESYYYIVDATSGEVITKIARQCSVLPNDAKNSPVSATHFVSPSGAPPVQPLAGFANATGTDLNGATQQLRTYQHTDGKYYSIWDLPNLNQAKSALPDQPQGGAMTLTLNNKDLTQDASIFHNTSSNNSWSDPTVVSAHHNMLVAYNYYNSTFARKAIDNVDGTIISIIHVTQDGQGMDNAFWNGAGKVMIYGDGNTEFKALAGGIDVAGHEMTHGVINNTADLVYQFQSGALNESFADVFGVMVDTRNLTVGEDVMQAGKGTCLRDLADPHNASGLAHQPNHMNEFNNFGADQDNGGVHSNSGIPNRAAGILINQLGRDKVQKMYYRALTNYLTRNSQFIDCRHAVESAAKDLYGNTEQTAVSSAFATVGIGEGTTNTSEDDVPAQTGGGALITFTNNEGKIGLLNPSTGQWALASSDAAVARVTDGGNFRAQLTTPRNGGDIYFINPSGHLCYMVVSTGEVFTFPNLHLEEDGDLWNAAVAPDESIVAMTSDYYNDPNLYFFDGKDVFTLPLKTETEIGSISSIDYADVISWSPNKWEPKVGFDAYLANRIGSDSLDYWSMFEVDFSSKKIYDLIPAQTSDIDIGNISYSNTSPNLITFNVIQNGIEDVAIADFKTNNIGVIGASQKAIGGNPILDGDKPSFSPNDQFIGFTSPSNLSMLFYELGNANLTYLQFTNPQMPMYVPYWFLLGGSAGVSDKSTESSQNISIYPSTISKTAAINFDLKTSQEISLDVVNLFGQTIRKITSERMDAGSHNVKFDAEGLASGTYFIRLLTKETQVTAKVVVQK